MDNLSGRFLKDGAKVLAKPITDLFNLSITPGKFPNSCKLAKLKARYKKGSLTEASNYRPISLLPLIWKVIEPVIHDQTSAFLNFIQNLQNHSANFCFSFLNENIPKRFDQVSITGMILIDLQKAFDTIEHDILLQKLYATGFSKHSVNWFRSDLINRTFLVNLGNVFSQPACGVPQESILALCTFSHILMICHKLSTKDINEIAKQLNKGFESICGCFFDNKVSIHFGDDKTKSKLFGTKFKIKKVRKLLCNCRQLLCNALIQSYFDYACSAWYPNSTKKLKNRIQAFQNKCIRFCLQLDKMTHIS